MNSGVVLSFKLALAWCYIVAFRQSCGVFSQFRQILGANLRPQRSPQQIVVQRCGPTFFPGMQVSASACHFPRWIHANAIGSAYNPN
jgi:hypothetical protein